MPSQEVEHSRLAQGLQQLWQSELLDDDAFQTPSVGMVSCGWTQIQMAQWHQRKHETGTESFGLMLRCCPQLHLFQEIVPLS